MRTPDRDLLNPPSWPTLRSFLRERLAADADVEGMLAEGRFVRADGTAITGDEPCAPNQFLWFHRDLRDEPVVPFDFEVLYRDERIIVVDKPHFLSTIPRGRHVLQSVVVRARDRFALPELGAAHRLDRLTAGVLVLTTEQRWRAAYQTMFEHRSVAKSYLALAPVRTRLGLPATVVSHIRKRRGHLQAEEVPGADPNARTLVELAETRGDYGRYLLTPLTGKTHQLRVHLNSLGIPIVGDPLYPEVIDVELDDFRTALQLVARTLQFTDPVDGSPRHFESRVPLEWP